MRIVIEVDGNVGLIRIAENALQFLLRGAADGRVDLVLVGIALGKELEIDDRNVGVGTRMELPSSLPASSA